MSFLENKLRRLSDWFEVKKTLIIKTGCKKFFLTSMGEVYYANLGINVGSEIDKVRPVMVYQGRNKFLRRSDTVFVFPLTTNLSVKKFKVKYDDGVIDDFRAGAILVDQGRTISKTRLGQKIGCFPVEILFAVCERFEQFCCQGTVVEKENSPPLKISKGATLTSQNETARINLSIDEPFEVVNLVRKNILNLTPYASARSEMKGPDYVFLDANENPLCENRLARYPDPMHEVIREKLALRAGCMRDEILLGNGSDELIDLLVRTFCDPEQDSIIVCPPTFGMYEVAAQIQAIETTNIALDSEYQLDVETIINTSAKLVFLPNPGAPTGNLLKVEDIEYLLKNFKGLVVLDEAYIDFAKAKSWTSRLVEFSNLVVLQTFSKYWGLAGTRAGMMYASREIVDYVSRLKPPYNVNNLTAAEVIKALDNEPDLRSKSEILISERARLEDFFMNYKSVERVYPSEANYLWIKLVSAEAVLRVYETLKSEKIIIRKYSAYPEFIRVSVGSPDENDLLMKVLR